MLRRTFLNGAIVTAMAPATSLPGPHPEPVIFRSEVLSGMACTGMPITSVLRAEFLRQMASRLLPPVRNATIHRRTLMTRFTFEAAYDGIRPGDAERVEQEIISGTIYRIVSELEPMTPLRLVRLDTDALRIDPEEGFPVIPFFVEWNR